MVKYRVVVSTGTMLHAGTYDNIFLTLVGMEGESGRTLLNIFGRDFAAGSTGKHSVTCSASLGTLLLIQLDKEEHRFMPDNNWFCSKVVVTTPESDTVCFPCYRWVSKGETLLIREATAEAGAGGAEPHLPPDSEHDWLLAKMFVRSADFTEHQLNSHLLRAHLMAELLSPHTRYTIQMNSLARERLISKDGILTVDITARGLESVSNFYYRDDGLRLWDIINRFVQGIVRHYYCSDSEVRQDSELQSWIGEIFTHGFLGRTSSGIPQAFSTVEELIKFITMVIFTVSGQHSAVNSGQFDFGGWFPNNPSSLQQPPPTTKGSSTKSSIVKVLPDVNITVQIMSSTWLLSKKPSDFVSLGVFPDEHFCEVAPLRLVLALQADLKALTDSIKERNAGLELPYPYLCPEEVENSVAV